MKRSKRKNDMMSKRIKKKKTDRRKLKGWVEETERMTGAN
jgi:hypothetical protein